MLRYTTINIIEINRSLVRSPGKVVQYIYIYITFKVALFK